jgi:hypothetical protein
MMTLAMPVTTILGAADINEPYGYYHCSDGQNFACGYYENHSRCYCARL